jgi:hypothetical protein
LVAIEMLALPSVRWGNFAALTTFSMEAGLVFLTTLYLQNVLHFGPLATGLVFGVPGFASVAAGVVARPNYRPPWRAVVAATVTATSEVPDAHKGLATGLVTTSQRVAVTVGIPILGAVVANRADLLSGIRLALAADVLFTLTAVILIRAGLNRRKPLNVQF